MNNYRFALAALRYPASPLESVTLAEQAIAQAAAAGAQLVCFPECYVPGYRGLGHVVAAPSAEFQEQAWQRVCAAAAKAGITVLLGTERLVGEQPVASVLVINPDGTRQGFQDKVQLDPSEDPVYLPGVERRLFAAGPLTFGVVICHEGWRYPETVRWAARRGAQIVFHPHLDENEPGAYQASTFADPRNTFHEKAGLCRAAENTVYYAMVNYCVPHTSTTSAVVNPDGTLHSYQPYGQEGLLVAEVDLDKATGYLASRCKS